MASAAPGDSSLDAERNRARDRLAASRSELAAAAREAFPPRSGDEPVDAGYPRSHLFQAVTRHHKAIAVGLGLLALSQPRRVLAFATRSMALVATVRGLSNRMGLR